MSFKDISISSSCGNVVQWSRMICAVVVEGIIRNISMYFFLVSGDCCVTLPRGAMGLSADSDCGIS